MKKTIKILIPVLICALLLPVFTSCSLFSGSPILELGKVTITGNMLDFWLSRYKAQFVYYYSSAIKAQYNVASIDEFWKLFSDQTTGQTYDDLFTSYIVDNAKTYLCSLYLFDQLGLKLDSETVKSVDDYIDELIDTYADGSKSEFNAVVAKYGVNSKILREIYLIDEKVKVLQNHLYGPDGTEKITQEQMEKYYQDNYVRMKQICIFINECPEVNADGTFKTDEEGKTAYRQMSAAENAVAREKADSALAKLNGGTDFEAVLREYDENTADDSYENGIYMSAESAYGNDQDLQKIFEALGEMKVGEYRMIELSYGLHIVKKLELDAGAYKDTANTDFFTFWDSDSQTYVEYAQFLKTPMFLEYIKERLAAFSADIKIDEEELARHKISDAQENYYF